MSEAPLLPGEPGEPTVVSARPEPPGDAVAGRFPAAAAGYRHLPRYAAGLSRRHGWRSVALRLIAFAVVLGGILYVLAAFVRGIP